MRVINILFLFTEEVTQWTEDMYTDVLASMLGMLIEISKINRQAKEERGKVDNPHIV